MHEVVRDTVFAPLCGTGTDREDHDDGDLAVAPAKPQLKKPPLYRVILLNDDYTPMEFVVQVLEQFFGMGREKATRSCLRSIRRVRAYVEYILRILPNRRHRR